MSRDTERRTTVLDSNRATNSVGITTVGQASPHADELAQEAVGALGQGVARELLRDENVRQAAKVGLAVGGIAFGLTLLGGIVASGGSQHATQQTTHRR